MGLTKVPFGEYFLFFSRVLKQIQVLDTHIIPIVKVLFESVLLYLCLLPATFGIRFRGKEVANKKEKPRKASQTKKSLKKTTYSQITLYKTPLTKKTSASPISFRMCLEALQCSGCSVLWRRGALSTGRFGFALFFVFFSWFGKVSLVVYLVVPLV